MNDIVGQDPRGLDVLISISIETEIIYSTNQIFEEELKKHGQECRMKNLVEWCTGVPGPENKKGKLAAWD